MVYTYKNIDYYYIYMDNKSVYISSIYIKNTNDTSYIEFPSYIDNRPVKDIKYDIITDLYFWGYNLSNIKYIKFPDHCYILPNKIDNRLFNNIKFIKFTGIIIKIKNNKYSIL